MAHEIYVKFPTSLKRYARNLSASFWAPEQASTRLLIHKTTVCVMVCAYLPDTLTSAMNSPLDRLALFFFVFHYTYAQISSVWIYSKSESSIFDNDFHCYLTSLCWWQIGTFHLLTLVQQNIQISDLPCRSKCENVNIYWGNQWLIETACVHDTHGFQFYHIKSILFEHLTTRSNYFSEPAEPGLPIP